MPLTVPVKPENSSITGTQASKFAASFGLVVSPNTSNLAAPTKTLNFSPYGEGFSMPESMSVSDKVPDTEPVRRRVIYSRGGFPYRKARLVKSRNDWHISFYAWDIGLNKLVRKRVGKAELYQEHARDREAHARKLISIINLLLKENAYLDSSPNMLPPPPDYSNIPLLQAIDIAQEYKRDVDKVKQSTLDEYRATKSTVMDFYDHVKIRHDFSVRGVTPNFVAQYLEYLKKVRGSSNKTYNCRLAMLHSVCKLIIWKDPHAFGGKNPFTGIPFLKTESKKHAAYSDDQMKLFADRMIKNNEPDVLLFMQFMYYTLARPEELRLLKVGHIRLADRRILFVSENAKTSIEQYVGINDRFADIIARSRICEFPESYYVFSNQDYKGGHHPCKHHHPGPVPVGKGYFYKHVKRYINALGFRRINANYTMYSFKHSGAISLYRATKDIKLLQQQCRHQTIEQTNNYLRDLGLFEDFSKMNAWTGPI